MDPEKMQPLIWLPFVGYWTDLRNSVYFLFFFKKEAYNRERFSF